MFGIFSSKKQNSLKNPVYLEKFINNAYLELSNSIKSPNELYLFLIEELCGASQGNNDGKQLVDFSQFHEIEYRNALNKESAMDLLMCAEKTGGFNLVNYRHSSGVYHEQETEDLHRRI